MRRGGHLSRGSHPWLTTAAPPGHRMRRGGHLSRSSHPWLTTAAPPGHRMRRGGHLSRGSHPWLTTAAPPGHRMRRGGHLSRGSHPWLTTAAPPGLRTCGLSATLGLILDAQERRCLRPKAAQLFKIRRLVFFQPLHGLAVELPRFPLVTQLPMGHGQKQLAHCCHAG